MADSTLQAIRTKVRRLTRTLTENQLQTTTLDDYINTFVLYDFPEHLRLFSLRKNFTFTTNVGQDEYPTSVQDVVNPNNPLYDFNNRYITVHKPVYIGGYQAFYSQSQEQFFNVWPKVKTVSQNTGVSGNGITQTFTAQFPTLVGLNPGASGTVLGQRSVFITAISSNGVSMTLTDVPVLQASSGYNLQDGNLYVVGTQPGTPPLAVDATNTINYTTGIFTVTFPAPPGAGEPIIIETRPYPLARPQALLYFDNKFLVRPIPDKGYSIEFEAYIRPTELLSSSQEPELQQWWQYIAYGAAKKYFEDQQDPDSVAAIMPEYKQQERLVLRRTLVQQTNERVATIYTEANFGYSWFNGGNTGGN